MSELEENNTMLQTPFYFNTASSMVKVGGVLLHLNVVSSLTQQEEYNHCHTSEIPPYKGLGNVCISTPTDRSTICQIVMEGLAPGIFKISLNKWVHK